MFYYSVGVWIKPDHGLLDDYSSNNRPFSAFNHSGMTFWERWLDLVSLWDDVLQDLSKLEAVPQNRRLVACFPLRRRGFDARSYGIRDGQSGTGAGFFPST
jgi:hypothetical protein